MQRVVCLLATDLQRYAFEPLGDGGSALAASAAFARSLGAVAIHVCADLAQVEAIRATMGEAGIQYHSKSTWNWNEVLVTLAGLTTADQELVLAYADAPFLNRPLVDRLEALHGPYRAHFTFAEAFPQGLAVELVDPSVLGPMAELAQRYPEVAIGRSGLFELLKKDVNAFDIETEIADLDLRLLRIKLFAQNADQLGLCRNVATLLGPGWADRNPDEIAGLLNVNGEILRTIPSYFSLQLTDNCPQACSYCPFGADPAVLTRRGSMDRTKLFNLVDRIAAWNPEAYIDVSLWGEPSRYPHFAAFAEHVLSHPDLRLYVETSGIGWDRTVVQGLATRAKGRVTWILSLDSMDRATYAKMRGEGYDEAWDFARWLPSLYPSQVYMQAVRCDLNEAGMKEFYDYWKAEKQTPMIQKYDHFSRALPDRRISDIAPYQRFPCWHLKRDFNVLMDGRVVQCREDLTATQVWGNAFTEDLPTIWLQGLPLYKEHLQGQHRGLCEHCDEYYTFNA